MRVNCPRTRLFSIKWHQRPETIDPSDIFRYHYHIFMIKNDEFLLKTKFRFLQFTPHQSDINSRCRTQTKHESITEYKCKRRRDSPIRLTNVTTTLTTIFVYLNGVGRHFTRLAMHTIWMAFMVSLQVLVASSHSYTVTETREHERRVRIATHSNVFVRSRRVALSFAFTIFISAIRNVSFDIENYFQYSFSFHLISFSP